MNISLNIREWCGIHCGDFVDKYDCRELRAIADRIDREMVELPKDADGELIHIGDVVYGNAGVAWTVASLRLFNSGWKVDVDEFPFFYKPGDLTHEKPEPDDSWEKLEEDAACWTECDYAQAPRDEHGLVKCDECRFQKSNSCKRAMILDMIARAKKLAGIEEEATE